MERKGQARSGKDGVAVSEGNGSVLWGLARMCGAWQYWWEWTGEARLGAVCPGSYGELGQGDAWSVWAVE